MNRFILLFIFLCTVMLRAQAPAVSLKFFIYDNNIAYQTLKCGLDSTATNDIDESLGEFDLPPVPSFANGPFDARFTLSHVGVTGIQGTWTDIRPGTFGVALDSIEYRIRVQPGYPGDQVTIKWFFPPGVTATFKNNINQIRKVNAKNVDSLIITASDFNATVHNKTWKVIVYYPVVYNGWNTNGGNVPANAIIGGNLTIGASGGTIIGQTTVQGTLQLNGPLTVGSNTLTVQGFSGSGTVSTDSTSVLILNGAGSVNIPSSITRLRKLVVEDTTTGSGTGNLTTDSLELTGSSVLNIGSQNFKVKKNLYLAGTVTGSGKIIIQGSSSPLEDITTITGDGVVSNLEIDNADGVLYDDNNKTLDITGTLTLTSGKLTLGTNNLFFGTSGSMTGGNSSKYIITNSTGKVKQHLSGPAKDYYVGPNSTMYNPVTLTNAGFPDYYSVVVADAFPSNVLVAADTNKTVRKVWTISEDDPTGSNLTIALTWNTSDQGTVFNPAETVNIGRYTGSAWVPTAGSVSGSGPYTVTASGFIALSNFGVGNDGPLPVELTSFTATAKGNSVQLLWKTATEVNNYGFEIERRAFSAQSFETVGFVNGGMNSNSPREYAYTDNGVKKSGKYVYRLKQIDADGSFEYSNEVEVEIITVTEYLLLQNYPNPFNPTTLLQYQVPEQSNISITLYNVLGNEVAQIFKGVVTAGVHSQVLDMNQYGAASGIYYITMKAPGFTQTIKATFLK